MNRIVLIMVRGVALILTIALWCWLLGCTLAFVFSRLGGSGKRRLADGFTHSPPVFGVRQVALDCERRKSWQRNP